MLDWLLNKFNSWFKKAEPVETKPLKDMLNKNYGQKPVMTKQDIKLSSEVKYGGKANKFAHKSDSSKSSSDDIYNPYHALNPSGIYSSHSNDSYDSGCSSSYSSSSSDSGSSSCSSSGGGD